MNVLEIWEAAKQPSLLMAALAYARLGMSVITTKGKLASVHWIPQQKQRATAEQIQYWHKRGLMHGIGIVCGAVSNNLVVMDLDGLQSVTNFEFEFPELLDTYTVVSGSGKGKHIYWHAEKLPPTTRVKGFELRANEMYVVVPPSIHPETKQPYTVEKAVEVAYVHDLDRVVEFIEAIRKERQREQETGRSQNHEPKPAINKSFYGVAALTDECNRVRATATNVNDQVNLSAFKLGQLVALGYLSESLVESELLSAAAHLSARDGENLTVKTIRSGLRAGMTKAIERRKALE